MKGGKMTDKIMIDGVDVSGCKRRIGKDNYCRYFKRPCNENNYNCVWKQLARKTEECEQLKKDLESAEFIVRPTTDDYIKQIAEAVGMTDIRLSGGKEFYTWLKDNIIQRIKAERQKVEELEKDIQIMEDPGLSVQISEERYRDFRDTKERYKQALKDIKKVATDLRTRTNYHSPDEVNSDIDKILQHCEVAFKTDD